MYELEHVKHEVLNTLFIRIQKVLDSNKHYLLPLAIKYAFKKEYPSMPNEFISQIVRDINKKLNRIQKRIIVNYENEDEAKKVFENQFGHLLDMAEKGQLEDGQDELVYNLYLLSKYDKKMIIYNKEFSFNGSYLISRFGQHLNADAQWMNLNKNRLSVENNFNISNNSATTVEAQIKYLNPEFTRYKNNPLSEYDLEKELQMEVIDWFKADNQMTARSLMEISKIPYNLDKFAKYDHGTIIKTLKNMSRTINSDKPISRKMIVRSWLSHIVFLYKRLNNNGISDKEIKKLVDSASKATYLFKNRTTPVFTLDQIKNFNFKEVGVFNKLRLIDYTDNQKITKRNQETVEFMETYLSNISDYLKKHID